MTARGWTWGIGPVWLLPTATDDLLGGEKWGLGPTGVALKHHGQWTYGMLANHIRSFAGDDDRADVNATFLQPSAACVIRTHTTIGRLPIQLSLGTRCWAESTENGPARWGGRLQLTFIFPK